MIVMKFGGTSVADADAIARVAGLVRAARERDAAPPLVVVSAMSGITDRLLSLAATAETGDDAHVCAGVDEIWHRHVATVEGLFGDRAAPSSDNVLGHLERHIGELRALLTATAILRETSPRARDGIVAVGELLSSHIVAGALDAAGVPAAWVDARRALVTDASFTAAVPLLADTTDAAAREFGLVLSDGRVPVVGGFVGATRDGITTTLGRGGSDYSAAIFGAALDAEEIQIWTDVDGMLTADPRVIERPRLVPHLSFAEASELAYFGAKVLHPSTVLPAIAKDIPVRILNSARPHSRGTLITGRAPGHDCPLTAIACKRRLAVIDIRSTRMLMAHGFLRKVFEVFERFQTSVDVVTTSEVSVSVTVDDMRRVPDIAESLRAFAEVTVEQDMAILCAVGDNLQIDARLGTRVLAALDGFGLRMVSQAASRRNVTVVLRDSDLAAAMERLHGQFFPDIAQGVGGSFRSAAF
jgi:aspartate kinase